MYAMPRNSSWEGNIAYATGEAVVSGSAIQGVKEINPGLVDAKGMWRLQRSSPAIDAAVGEFPFVKNDMEEQLRDNKKDVGADEFSFAKPKNRPLSAKDVGPNAR
jgi:poly(beta-D-mannuronate) lyase